MPSFVKRIRDRLDEVRLQMKLLEKEEQALGKEFRETLISRLPESAQKLKEGFWSCFEETLEGFVADMTEKRENRPSRLIFDGWDVKALGYRDFTELKIVLRELECAWSDFIRIEIGPYHSKPFLRTDGLVGTHEHMCVYFFLLEYDYETGDLEE